MPKPTDQIIQEWKQRSDSENFSLNKKWLLQHTIQLQQPTPNSRVVFSHIPKNAGTTLEYILAKNFLLAETLHINAPDLLKQPGILEAKRNHPRLICGHHPLHGALYQLLNEHDIIHITMLRNPVDRVISYYNYVTNNQQHPLHIDAKKMSFDQFIQEKSFPEIHNGQIRRLTGHLHSNKILKESKLLAQANQVLDECFSVVLFTEHFDLSLLILKEILGLNDIFYQHKNKSQQSIKKQHLTTQQMDAVLALNSLDAILFAQQEKRFLNKFQSQEKAPLLEKFQLAQKQWQTLLRDE